MDGQPLTLTPGAEEPLPGGATLIVEDSGRPVVRWPDGTELLPVTNLGRSTLVRLAPARWGGVEGVLGDADGEESDDVQVRGGAVITDVYDHAQLYGAYAPS